MPETVSLQLEFFHPWPNNVGPYLARERGLLEDGVDLRIATGDAFRGEPLDHVARGEVTLAYVPLNRLLARREAGDPLVALAVVNHRPLESLATVRATGITRARDLAGRRVGHLRSGRLSALLADAVANDGGDPGAVEAVDTGMREPGLEDVVEGRYDAAWGGVWAWEALLGDIPAEERVVIPADDLGAQPFVSYVIAAREDEWERRREVLAPLLAAFGEGYRLAADDVELAAATVEHVIPIFPPGVVRASVELLAPTWFHEGRWGGSRPDIIGPYAAWLAERGLLGSAAVADGAFAEDA